MASTRELRYRCTQCGKRSQRRFLTVKQVRFLTMGKGGKVLKNRAVAWLCATCRDEDPAWNMPPHQESPSLTLLAEANGE